MKSLTSKAVPVVLAAALFGGCASPGYNVPAASQPYPSYPAPVRTYPAASPSHAYSTGTIDSIQMRQNADSGIGVGAVVGGVVGGLLGNQVGGGSGKKAATVAGVVGGAMVGHQMERSGQARDAYEIRVRLDNGGYQTVVQDSIADLQVGSRVRVDNQRVYRAW